MIYKTILLLCLLSLCYATEAQNNYNSNIRLSAETNQYLAASPSVVTNTLDPKYVYSQKDKQQYINAFIKTNASIEDRSLNELGILIGTKAGDIWTLKVPVDQVAELARLEKGIEAIQLDQPVAPNLDKAREKTGVDQVHAGFSLAQSFSGKDVVVGILDVGFDYTHPTFYDTSGENYRVKRIWAQRVQGTPPAGYSYGHELTIQEDMLASETDIVQQSHGTHVAGIAAGSGYGGVDSSYLGVAYESDLVFVGITPPQEQWTNTGMTDIVDGINYVFEYAASQGKPAVANLSWGCSIGPHDGTSLFSQAVNNLTGAGRIFTISAGNNGGNRIHLEKAFSDTDTVLHSFMEFDPNLSEKKTWVDVWGDAGADFCLELATYDRQTAFSTTDFICLDGSVIDTFLIGSDNDTFFLKITTKAEDINGRPHAFLDLHSQTTDIISIKIKATKGTVHGWMGYVIESTGYYGRFYNNAVLGAISGNDKMTIGEMACTESAITVGAFASKNKFTNISGSEVSYANYVRNDRICPFSSKGPTSDGRTKPDITAPGMTLASAVSSFDTGYAIGGNNYSSLVYKYTDVANDRDYYYAESSGTSMSAPMVAGIVALVLEAQPTATPEELIRLMTDTAIKDSGTGLNPIAAIWGAGKIDALAMLQNFFPSSTEEHFAEQNWCFPNPTADILNLRVPSADKIVITNVIQETVLIQEGKVSSLSLKSINPGIYVLSAYSKEGQLLAQERVVKQ